MKTSQTLVMLIVFLTLAFNVNATYTLSDSDVVMDANGYIISCSYSFVDKDIIIPETLDGIAVKGIGDDYNNLFKSKGITSIQFPSGLEYIGRYGFSANQLVSIDFPAGLTSISERAFATNLFTSISIPGHITSIGAYAFAYNPLTSVTILDGVVEIGPSAFRSCKITDISLPGSVIFIREYAFYRNLFSTISIPNSVCLIERENFSYNANFTGIILPTVAKTGFVDWIDGNGNHYAGGETATDSSTIYRANIPYTLTNEDVEMDANGYIISCSYNFEASMITIPDVLDGYTVAGIGDDRKDLFFNKAITSVQFPSGIAHIGYSAFSENLLSSFTIPANLDSIPDHMLSYNLLSEITIPNSVVYVGSSAFQVNKMTSVTLSENLTFIGNNAFRNNELTAISIPDKVLYIGSNAFIYNQLTEFTLPSPTVPGFIDWMDGNGNHYDAESTVSDLSTYYTVFIPYTLTDDDVEMDTSGYIISCNYNFELTDIAIPDMLDGYEVKGISDNYNALFYNKGITSVQLPSGMEHLGRSAFGNNALTGIDIPGSLKVIGSGAFYENKIKNLVLPEGVESIGASAFYNNKMLSAALPNSITSIGEGAFRFNYLDSIGIPGSLSRIEKNVFWGNNATKVNIPEGVTYIGESAFGGNQLTSVELPNSLVTIYHQAFSRNQLKSVTIPNSVTYISSSAFSENQFLNFLLPTPDLPGFINWVDTEGNYFEGGTEVPVERFTPKLYRARVPYTLKDEDVEMDANGYILSCSYHFQGSMITIPETLDGITVKGIADGQNYLNPGPFSGKVMLSVQFPSGMEHIGDYSFYNNLISDIDFPDSLSYLGDYSFATNRLESVVLPNKDLELGRSVFTANRITEVNFPEGITSIPSGFLSANLLTSVTIPNSVLSIGISAFSQNNQLAGYILPAPEQSGFYDWVDNTWNSYQAGDSVTRDYLWQGFEARFAYTLTDEDVEVDTSGYITSCIASAAEKVYIIPDTLDGYEVKGIADAISRYTGVFFSYYKEVYVFPPGFEHIGAYAFSDNYLRNIYSLPNSIISIAENAFSYNYYLNGVVLPTPDVAGFVNWVDVNNGIAYEGGDTITDFSVKYEARFAYVLTDEDVEVDANGYIINFNPDNTKNSAFSKGATDIAIPDTLDGYAIRGIADGTVGSGVFYNRALSSVYLPAGMEYIGAYAFDSNQLNSIKLYSNVVYIGAYAFANNLLSEIILPTPNTPAFIRWIEKNSGIEYAGDDTITDFSGIYEAVLAYTLTDDDVEMDASGHIISCSYSFDNKDIMIPDTLDGYAAKGIADGMDNAGVFSNKAITSIILPDGLGYIGAYAFYSNQLTDVTIPNGVVSIGAHAFALNQLTGFVLPTPTVTGFTDWVDGNGSHHDAGTTVTDPGINYRASFPYTLTDADVEMDVNGYIISCSYGFEASIITIPETLDEYAVKGIGDDYNNLFYKKAITSIQLPSGLEHIGTKAFSDNLLTSVIIPNSVNYIGGEAFSSNLLTAVIIPNSVHYIGEAAFANNQLAGFVLPLAQKEGHTFDNWNGSIAANTEVAELSVAYTANFTLITGLENLPGFKLRVYPNPAKGFIIIEADDICSVEVISLSGVLVQKLQVTGSHCTIDLSSQKSGIYMLRITGKFGVCSKRFVKE